MDRSDELLSLSRVTDGLPHRPHRTTKCGVTDELVGPDLRTQLVFGDYTLMMLDEVHQDFKGFGTELDRLSCASEDMELGIEPTLAKSIDHSAP
jgi:hypothetical protein